MAMVLWTSALLLSAQLVASQGSGQCGRPELYEEKMLEEKHAEQSVFKNGEKVAYKCAKGYRMAEGRRVRYCRDGRWEPLNMSCTRKQCGSAGEIQNGYYDQKGNLFGDKAYAKCNKGYVLKGDPVRECLDEGWSGAIPSCEKAAGCSHPKLTNGRINGPKDVYAVGESLSLSCNVGHVPAGNTVTKCKKNGKWTHHLKCTVIKCPELKILDGTVNTTHVKFNETVNITCTKGFQLRGANPITCAANGSWAPAVPTCESGKCGPFPHYPDAEPREPRREEYESGAQVRFKCSLGFRWTGGSSSVLCKNGRWTQLDMRCEMIKCPELKILDGTVNTTHVKFNETVNITCTNGFQLRGANPITCAANGSWAPAVPTCESGERHSGKCGPFPHYPDAQPREPRREEYESGAQVRFKCSLGFRWTGGSSSVLCKNGRWTQLDMRCEKKSCGSAGEVANGRFHYTGVSFGDTATAECFKGYHLVGVGVRHCRAEGWDGRVPICEVVRCPSPPEVPGAEIYDPTDGHTEYRHVVSYTCLSGTMIGASDIYCTEHGTWAPDPPRCQAETSCPFPYVKFGSRIWGFKALYRPRDIVMFTCNPGYKLEGFATVSCRENGEWTPDLPTCVPVAGPRRHLMN